MSKPLRNRPSLPLDDAIFAIKRKPVPFPFVLEALAPLSPWTRPMFGCLAIYVQEKIVLILRDKPSTPLDNGVWLATTEDHHPSLRMEFPHMRSIDVLGKKITGWQVLPVDAQDFESSALRACDLVLAGDPRIGKVPGAKRSSKAKSSKAKSGKAKSRNPTSSKSEQLSSKSAKSRARKSARSPHRKP
jgi:hypothetical protein